MIYPAVRKHTQKRKGNKATPQSLKICVFCCSSGGFQTLHFKSILSSSYPERASAKLLPRDRKKGEPFGSPFIY